MNRPHGEEEEEEEGAHHQRRHPCALGCCLALLELEVVLASAWGQVVVHRPHEEEEEEEEEGAHQQHRHPCVLRALALVLLLTWHQGGDRARDRYHAHARVPQK